MIGARACWPRPSVAPPLRHPAGAARPPAAGWSAAAIIAAVPAARCANSFGWLFTEMGRQPWAVFGVMTTANGVSPSVGAGVGRDVADRLHPAVRRARRDRGQALLTAIKAGLPERPVAGAAPTPTTPDRPLAFAY